MINYQNKKVPIFTGINDTPIAPTPEQGGNISHFYDLYNFIVDVVQATVNNQGTIQADLYSLEYNFEQLSSFVNSLDTRITAIEQGSSISEEIFTFTGVNLATEADGYFHGVVGTIPKTGKITKITANSITDMFDTYVIIDAPGTGNLNDFIYLSIGNYIDTGNGFEWEIMDNGDNDVNQGETLILESLGQETNLTVTVHIYGVSTTPATPEPTLETFEFSGISTIIDDGYFATVGTIPKTGKLQKIAIDEITDGYNTFFAASGTGVLTFDAFETAPEGYQWTISDDGSQDVTQGQELSFSTTEEELDRTVTLYIYG